MVDDETVARHDPALPQSDQDNGRFNGFLKSVILRVNEARDLGDVDRSLLRSYEGLHRRAARREPDR